MCNPVPIIEEFKNVHCETLSFVGSQLISLNSLAPICARLSSFKQYLTHLFCDIWIFFKSRLFKEGYQAEHA